MTCHHCPINTIPYETSNIPLPYLARDENGCLRLRWLLRLRGVSSVLLWGVSIPSLVTALVLVAAAIPIPSLRSTYVDEVVNYINIRLSRGLFEQARHLTLQPTDEYIHSVQYVTDSCVDLLYIDI